MPASSAIRRTSSTLKAPATDAGPSKWTTRERERRRQPIVAMRTSDQVINEHQLTGGLSHTTEKQDGIGFVEMMEEERASEDVVIIGDRAAKRVQDEEATRLPARLRLLPGVSKGSFTQIGSIDLDVETGLARTTDKLTNDISTSASQVQNAKRSAGIFAARSFNLSPEIMAATTDGVNPAKTTKGLDMFRIAQSRLIHDLGNTMPNFDGRGRHRRITELIAIRQEVHCGGIEANLQA
jgi:hypothetical protein